MAEKQILILSGKQDTKWKTKQIFIALCLKYFYKPDRADLLLKAQGENHHKKHKRQFIFLLRRPAFNITWEEKMLNG